MTAIAQKELVDAIAQQARNIAEEAAQQRVSAKARLDKAQCNLSAAINEIKIAAVNERIMVVEVTYGKMDHMATTKSCIMLGASANAVTAVGNYQAAVRALEELRAQPSGMVGNTPSQAVVMTTMSPPSPLSPQATTTTTITPNSVGTIIPGNHYVRASSLLWAETNLAIQELQTNPQGDVAMAEAGGGNHLCHCRRTRDHPKRAAPAGGTWTRCPTSTLSLSDQVE
jgi:hypothetical protein